MTNLTRLNKPSILLLSFIAFVIADYAYGEMPKMRMTTDNGSTFIDVAIDKGSLTDNNFTIDSPQEVKFDIEFLHPGAFDHITHVNYEFHIADKSGNMVAHKTALHVHEGMDTQSVTFSDMGSFTLTINVIGTGLSQPYDMTNSGTASAMIAVTPEFPLGVMLVAAALVATSLVFTRFNNVLKR
jgi:hypothetical protein